jgi:DNA-binding transcriptional regulator/RsmH inhibitor MraZ
MIAHMFTFFCQFPTVIFLDVHTPHQADDVTHDTNIRVFISTCQFKNFKLHQNLFIVGQHAAS